jgi:GAF domain-containing protein
MPITAEQISHMRALYQRDGIRAVLVYLNSLTAHRFTALYRFDDEMLQNLYFYDREQPTFDSCPEIPVMASYCVFVRSSRKTFAISDSITDNRLGDHCKRREIRSYCGVPLLDEDGRMFGTICHFDHRPIPIGDDSVALMEAVASLFKSEVEKLKARE